MKEIKFRTWDKRLEVMEQYHYLQLSPKGQLYHDGMNVTDNYEIMQYTGLKDSRDKEIYEGDIVQVWEEDSHVPNRDSGGGIIDFDWKEGFSQLGVVSFKGAWYTYETKQHLEGREENIYAPLDFTNDLIVVGNIFENPELLDKK